MTVLTKSNITVKKIPLIDETHCDEESIEMQPTGPRRHARFGVWAILCLSFTVLVFVLICVATSLQIYDQLTTGGTRHYQGFCSVPLSRDMQMFERRMPLSWRMNPNVGSVDSDPDVQLISLLGEDPEVMDMLREVLDINVDDSVEKISVFNNDHAVSFIHDFQSNITGIVDDERCFTMDMDPEIVLQPDVLLFGLQHGGDFDVSRVRSRLRAELPAPPAPPAPGAPPAPPPARPAPPAPRCAGLPVYRLRQDTGGIIRKRAVDAPPHDYIQFAGKRVNEIEISNLADVLQYEQNIKRAA